MKRVLYLLLPALALSFAPLAAQGADNDDDVYKTQVPTGMELQQVGKNPGYKVVLPKGSTVRREGDVRIIEGSGEYAARKFTEYDARLDQMSADIESIKNDVAEIRKEMSGSKSDKLASR